MELKFRKLKADEIDCRVQQIKPNGLTLLLYKDARCDQNILDETVGAMNWQRHHNRDNANCIVSIWDSEKNQWVEKEDTGTESRTEKEKGLASDSFKRACFNWGIGRELYTAPNMFVLAKDLSTLKEENGRYTCRDAFEVTDIQYIDRNICYVRIRNRKTGNEIEFGTPAEAKAEEKAAADSIIDGIKKKVLTDKAAEKGIDMAKILARYHIASIDEMTVDNWMRAIKALEKTS